MKKWIGWCVSIVFCSTYAAEKSQRVPAILESKLSNIMISIEAIGFNYDASLIAIGGQDSCSHLKVLDVSKNFENILPSKETVDIVTFVKFGKGSNRLLSCRQNGKIVLSYVPIPPRFEKEINLGIKDFDRISVVNFSNDDTKIVIGSAGRQYDNLVMCRIHAGDIHITKLAGHKEKIMDALFNHDGTKLFSMSYDHASNTHYFKGWDVHTGALLFTSFIERCGLTALTRCITALIPGGLGFFQYYHANRKFCRSFFERIEEKSELTFTFKNSSDRSSDMPFEMTEIIDDAYKKYSIGIGIHKHGESNAVEICFFNKNDGKELFTLQPKTAMNYADYIAYNPHKRMLALEKRTDLILLTLPTEQQLSVYEENGKTKTALTGWELIK